MLTIIILVFLTIHSARIYFAEKEITLLRKQVLRLRSQVRYAEAGNSWERIKEIFLDKP